MTSVALMLFITGADQQVPYRLSILLSLLVSDIKHIMENIHEQAV